MNRLLLLGLITTGAMIALPETILAHGGRYTGPGDIVPPNPGGGRSTGGPSGPSTGGPAGPSTPGPAGPATPGPSGPGTGGPSGPAGPGAAKGPTSGRGGIQLEPDLTRWEFWWEFNKDPYISLKDAIHSGGPQTGSPEPFLGPGNIQVRDTLKPSTQDIVSSILPALKKALDSTKNRDIASSCMVAMAKVGKDHPDFVLLDTVFTPHLNSHDQEIREVAALSIGIAGLTGKNGESLKALEGLCLDDGHGRALTGQAEVDDRTRTFATYGLGLLARANADYQVQQRVFQALQQVLGDDRLSRSRNVRVAALNALSLLNLKGDSSEEKVLLDKTLGLLRKYYEDDKGQAEQQIQAHCPPAIAKLIGRHHDRSAEFQTLFTSDLEGKNKRTHANLLQSCVLALGQLVKPVDDDKSKDQDAASCRLLLEQTRTAKDAQVRCFSYLALGQIGGKANRRLLLEEFDKPTNQAQARAWIAIAMGVQEFHRRAAAKGRDCEPDRPFGEALRHALDEKNEELLGAVAIGLGLMQYSDAAQRVRALLIDNKSREELAGYLCISLALMEDRRSIPDIRGIIAKAVRRQDLLKQASIALGKLGDKEVADELQKLLKERDTNLATMSAIASALGFIGDRRTIDPLKALLFDTQLTELSRAFAAVALGGVGDKEKLPWSSKIGVNLNYRAAVETLTDKTSGILDIL